MEQLFAVREATLPNGLRVRLVPDDSAPVISLFTFFRVGSRNERPGITGISHLFEHMMFNGAKRYGPKQFDRELEARGGRSNAYTSTDLTVYFDDFASDALEKVLDLESDRMQSLSINPKTLANEREVVKEERRVRVDNDIGGLLDEELGALVFKSHPYRWPIIGWMHDIEAISKEDCEEYFRTFYAPNNATMYLAGDFSPDKALKLIRKYYGRIRRGPPIPKVTTGEPGQRGERRALVRHPAQAPSMMVAYRAPEAKHDDTFVLDVLQYALSVGEGSRLTRELVYRQERVISAGLDWTWRMDPGTLVFHLELKPDSDPAEVEASLYAILADVAENGISPSELQKAKNNLRAHLLRELATNSGRAHAFGNYEALLGSWREVFKLPERYEAVTLERVRDAAERYFAEDQRSVVLLDPIQDEERS